jgi:hypothetical protein
MVLKCTPIVELRWQHTIGVAPVLRTASFYHQNCG